MARSKAAARPAQEPPQVSPIQGIQLIEGQIAKAEELLKNRPLRQDDHSTWELVTRNYLEKAFGRHSPNIHSVTDVGKYGLFPVDAGDEWWEAQRAENLQTQLHKLGGLRDLLKTELQLTGGNIATVASEPSGHKIFLVHGHDDRALHETARFLERLQQEVIVLREQPNQGRTVIEKFENYADVVLPSSYSLQMI